MDTTLMHLSAAIRVGGGVTPGNPRTFATVEGVVTYPDTFNT